MLPLMSNSTEDINNLVDNPNEEASGLLSGIEGDCDIQIEKYYPTHTVECVDTYFNQQTFL